MQLVNRLIASETELGSEKIRNGKLSEEEWQQLHSKIKALIKAPIYVDDTPALSIFELRAKCRRLQQRYGIKVLIIDYLQLMTAGADMRGNREQEVSMISRQLKILQRIEHTGDRFVPVESWCRTTYGRCQETDVI